MLWVCREVDRLDWSSFSGSARTTNLIDSICIVSSNATQTFQTFRHRTILSTFQPVDEGILPQMNT